MKAQIQKGERNMKIIQISGITLLLTFLYLLLASNQAQSQNMEIEVHAGAFDRLHSVASFNFPHHVEEGVYIIRDDRGGETTIQVDNYNRGWLIIENLAAGSAVTYHFDGTKADDPATVNYQVDDDTILIKNGDNNVLSYFHGYNVPPPSLDERYRRGGYIHPVYTPAGTVLTTHLNENQHAHHSGIWSAWTNTVFQGRTPDFWNIHQNTGRVDHAEKLEESWKGPVFSGFRSKQYFTDLSVKPAVTALNEEWQVRVFRAPSDFHMFDLRVTQTANTSSPLYLPEYRYGGVGFRGHIDWDDPENCTFLTSEGLGRDGHGTRVKWTHIGGLSDGKPGGIAIMSHPENFRHPQTVRIHPDEPFFNYAPTQLGDMVIEPGSPYIVKYRYITYDGEPDVEKLNRLWNDFAYPPGVTVHH